MTAKLFDLMASRAAKAEAKPWEAQPQVEGRTACLTCGAGADKSGQDFIVAVGFGSAGVQASGEHIIEEQEWLDSDEFDGAEVSLALVERVALTRPELDWRIAMYAPLYEHEYQRQGDGRWVLIRRGEGFA